MKKTIRRASIILFAITMSVLCLIPQSLMAQQHVVNPSDLQNEMVSASATRQQNEATLNKFLTNDDAQKAFRDARVSPEQVKMAVHSLSDQELTKLTAQANQAQHDIDAGMSARLATIIIVAVVIAVVIILVVSL
jgi:Flp pilus assembly protein TadB